MSDWPTSLAEARERIIALHAEIERLRNHQNHLADALHAGSAENERLRAALRDAQVLIPNELVGPWMAAHSLDRTPEGK